MKTEDQKKFLLEVRKLLPLKQGLKHFINGKNIFEPFSSEAPSIKTRIETNRLIKRCVGLMNGSEAPSIKTRIETH